MPTTVKLSDLQLILLTAAAQRSDGSLLPRPDSTSADRGRVAKSVAALVKRELAAERFVAADPLSFRADGEQLVGATITNEGRTAIGIEASSDEQDLAVPSDGEATAAPLQPRAGSKQALLLSLLRRHEGATLGELVLATDWLPHTTHAALTGLRKKGHVLVKDKRDGATCYRLAGATA